MHACGVNVGAHNYSLVNVNVVAMYSFNYGYINSLIFLYVASYKYHLAMSI